MAASNVAGSEGNEPDSDTAIQNDYNTHLETSTAEITFLRFLLNQLISDKTSARHWQVRLRAPLRCLKVMRSLTR